MTFDTANHGIKPSPPPARDEHEFAKYDRIIANMVKRANEANDAPASTGATQGSSENSDAEVDNPDADYIKFGSTGFRELIRDAQIKLNQAEFESFLSGSIGSYNRYILSAETFEEQADNTRGGSLENLVAMGVGAAISGAASLYVLGRIGFARKKNAPQKPEIANQLSVNQDKKLEKIATKVGQHATGTADVAKTANRVQSTVAPPPGNSKLNPEQPKGRSSTAMATKEKGKLKEKKGKDGINPESFLTDANASDNIESDTAYFQAINILGGVGNTMGQNIGQFLKSEEEADNNELQGEQSELRALAESLKGLQDHSHESLSASLQSLGKFLEQITQAQNSVASSITV